jgi:hypothetical protein
MVKKTWSIGDNRVIRVKKTDNEYSVTICEEKSPKTITLTGRRWNQLVESIAIIDENLLAIKNKQYVKMERRLGGTVYVSVTTGYRCVDIRHFYGKEGVGPRPTKKGIALRLREWDNLKTAAIEIQSAYPEMVDLEPCMAGSDHYNQLVSY